MSLQQGNFEDRRQPNSPQNDIAAGGGPPYDSDMEARVARLEADVAIIKIDVAVIKANGATKADLAELKGTIKAEIAEAKTGIIMWVVGAIFVAQLLPLVKDLVRPPPQAAVVAPAPVNTK